MAGAFAAFEEEGLHDFEAGGPAEVGGAAVAGGKRGIAPEEVALRAGPDAVEQVDVSPPVRPVELVEVAVAVASEVAAAAGDGEGAGDAFAGVLVGADVGLLVAEAEVLGPDTWRRL